jgi:Uma2 family endonuclease
VKTAAEIQSRDRFAEPYRFTREDYDAMIAAGILDENDRVELIAGEILKKMSIGPSHASTVRLLNRIFSRAVGDRAVVAIQDPIALDDFSEPEPDVSLLAFRADSYACRHPLPQDVYLIVEVADTSLRLDRERKIPLYADAGIPEVWLIDLGDKTLTRYRKPASGAYAEVSRHTSADTVPIPNLPNATVALSELGL